ncbi:Nodulation protein S (NodS) [Arboricoccus pini]|uniref:Nodulation protein S (NodS) n=1 Tax=Arboricoccus pini TaxID=1963835 RepID=A0A212PVV3_9PROT|nr:SAM-dependent methyltransferase [Arboricoccus pini]SNB51041.1 Nodulation protein S (NodS) [Arboricoccus pini]
MSCPAQSLPAGYFERLYADQEDPWSFATSPYEQAKYAATLAALPQRHYASGLEIGCSIGVLTRQLAEHCQSLLAIDAAEAALARARRRNADRQNVTFARLTVPDERPEGSFDLIVLSEVVYYWNLVDIQRVAALVEASLLPGGSVILVHWIKPTDYPLSGDQAVEAFLQATAGFLSPVRQAREENYRLDLLIRRG